MTGETGARDVVVLKSYCACYRSLCLVARCPWPLGARFPDYAGAKADKAGHLHWHGNQKLQEWHAEAREHVGRLRLQRDRGASP